MEQIAIVKNTDGAKATVSVSRRSMCDGCSKSTCDGGCAVGNIFGNSSEMTTEAENCIGARAGDKVIVETSSGDVLSSAVLVFIFPIVLAFLSYFISLKLTSSESSALLFALGGFVVAFAVIGIYERLRAKNKIKIKIVKIIESDDSACGEGER